MMNDSGMFGFYLFLCEKDPFFLGKAIMCLR